MITAEELLELGFEIHNTGYYKRKLGDSYAGEADYTMDMSEYCSIDITLDPVTVELSFDDGFSNYTKVVLHSCKTSEQIRQLINMF